MEQKKPNLRCNSEYKRLYQPITEQAYLQLEAELKDFTDIVDIKTWVSIVLCDYEKLEICKKYNIAYRASRLYVRNSEEALLWLTGDFPLKDLLTSIRRARVPFLLHYGSWSGSTICGGAIQGQRTEKSQTLFTQFAISQLLNTKRCTVKLMTL